MSSELCKKAILAYRLRNQFQQSNRAELTPDDIEKLNQNSTPKESQILNAPISVLSLIEFMCSDDEETVIQELEASEQEDFEAVIEECALPLDLFARSVPALFTDFKAKMSDQQKHDISILKDVAPNFVALVMEEPA